MAYQTASVADATALRLALTTFATANGWTWDAANEVLSIGNVLAKLTAPSVGELRIQGGTSIDVNGALVNPAAGYCRIMDLGTNKPITWPVIYHFFLNTAPDDLVCLINFDAAYWEWMGLGQCTNLGVPGTAAWFGATVPNAGISATTSIIQGSNSLTGYGPAAPFWIEDESTGGSSSQSTSYLHSNIDGSDGITREWACDNNALMGRFYEGFTPLLERQPNAWNGESILIPARIVVPRPAGLFSYAAEMPHARLLKIDNYIGGDIITLGPDQWFAAPFFRKNTGVSTNTDTGTLGWAIRVT